VCQLVCLIPALGATLRLHRYYVSRYNTVMKIFYIATTAAIVVSIRFLKPWKETYQAKMDVFPRWYLLVPAMVLAFIPGLHDRFTVLEVTWSFSIYLEALAVIPQLMMLRKCGEIEMYMLVYLLLLATYRTL
jgi:ER lumen protein retaining receptor